MHYIRKPNITKPPPPPVLSTCARCPVNLPGFPPFPVSSEKFFTNAMVSGFSLFLSAQTASRGGLWKGVFNALGLPK